MVAGQFEAPDTITPNEFAVMILAGIRQYQGAMEFSPPDNLGQLCHDAAVGAIRNNRER